MAHSTVGYCFTGTPEAGGIGMLIGLHRCQAYRVAQKKHTGADGNSYAKGDVIPTDCNVTGTDIGTPSKPKYALKNLWEHVLIPALERLVAPGGRCDGAMVVHQEDNAGALTLTLTQTLTHTLTLTLTLTQTLMQDLIRKVNITNG